MREQQFNREVPNQRNNNDPYDYWTNFLNWVPKIRIAPHLCQYRQEDHTVSSKTGKLNINKAAAAKITATNKVLDQIAGMPQILLIVIIVVGDKEMA